jgi:proline iminopeptidase
LRYETFACSSRWSGRGYPLVLMHAGSRADHWTLLRFRRLADRFTLVFYDHRCNGRPVGVPVSSMTWENLTADTDALRESSGLTRGRCSAKSYGGKVALGDPAAYISRR